MDESLVNVRLFGDGLNVYEIWKIANKTSVLPRPVVEWKCYDCDTQLKKVIRVSDDHNVYLVYMNLYDDVWIMAILKYLEGDLSQNPDEILLHRRLARFDGLNFMIPNPYLMEKEDPVNHNKGLITTLGYTYEEKTRRFGFLFPVYDYSLSTMPLSLMSSETRRSIFTSCLAGLHALHSWGFRHNDVKLPNILYSLRGETVLCDFGISDSGKHIMKTVQTKPYRPFEQYSPPSDRGRKRVYGYKTDVYALGCVYRILTRKSLVDRCFVAQYRALLFEEMDENIVFEYFKDVYEDKPCYYRKLSTFASISPKDVMIEKDAWMKEDVIKQMLHWKMSVRPSALEIATSLGLDLPRMGKYHTVDVNGSDPDVSDLVNRIKQKKKVDIFEEFSRKKLDITFVEKVCFFVRFFLF